MDDTNITTAIPAAEQALQQLRALPEEQQLAKALDLLSTADQAAERLNWITSEVWAYTEENQLWVAGNMTLEEVKARIDWSAVCRRIQQHEETMRCPEPQHRRHPQAVGATAGGRDPHGAAAYPPRPEPGAEFAPAEQSDLGGGGFAGIGA